MYLQMANRYNNVLKNVILEDYGKGNNQADLHMGMHLSC